MRDDNHLLLIGHDVYLSAGGANSTIPVAPGYAGPAPTLGLHRSGSQWEIVFEGQLQETSSLQGGWSDVPGAVSPYAIPAGGERRFYRAVCR
ncbi:MAG TPA: hypothetical protein PKM73_14330 [Verrucomicrobiota bacterium]|nr:hypothetical protein [Verrucomicrobiota bacterium]HNU53197.1 hypothetical protein [Verrucomicrobiota bacterium]